MVYLTFINFFRSSHLWTPATITQFLDDVPRNSDIRGSNRDDDDEIEFIARRRDKGLNLFSSLGAGMFTERDGSDDNEDADDLGGGDQGGSDQGRDDKVGPVSNDELLPDLEMQEAPIGELTKKKARQKSKHGSGRMGTWSPRTWLQMPSSPKRWRIESMPWTNSLRCLARTPSSCR